MHGRAQPDFEADRKAEVCRMWRAGFPFDHIAAHVGLPESDVADILLDRQRRIEPPSPRLIPVAVAPLKARRLAEILPDITTPGLRARLESRSPAAGIVGGLASPRREASLFASAGASAPAAFSNSRPGRDVPSGERRRQMPAHFQAREGGSRPASGSRQASTHDRESRPTAVINSMGGAG